jgi:hypothetical protein
MRSGRGLRAEPVGCALGDLIARVIARVQASGTLYIISRFQQMTARKGAASDVLKNERKVTEGRQQGGIQASSAAAVWRERSCAAMELKLT